MIDLPQDVLLVTGMLRRAGFEARAVGGCVRDSLLGLVPHDWDVCTDARPESVKEVFRDLKTYSTGSRHGTVGVRADGRIIEVTTYRTDGPYSDNRRPDSVTFVASLEEDLARRDFTINAMAYCPEEGLTDPFGGREDLEAGIIRCVGEPERRFEEDALRILRALRFSSRYGFRVEERTARAATAGRRRLGAVSVERVFEELKGIITGPGAGDILEVFPEIISCALPGVTPDEIRCAAAAVGASPGDICSRLAMLLRAAGAERAKGVLERLRCDKKTARDTIELVEGLRATLKPEPVIIRKLISKLGKERFDRLISLREAAARGDEDELSVLEGIKKAADSLYALEGRITMKTLAVGGDDVLSLGAASGPFVGRILRSLLDGVLGGSIPNEKAALMRAAERFMLEHGRSGVLRDGN
ncbi:MAG: tRNA nucleotidyltransferase [Clostridiales bacterium]|jgi:tRNA nucleotidyltransferase (CCA-adding enzyme)|nr:tRNA nucleotidyltransferase [Clostridiales bacterium]